MRRRRKPQAERRLSLSTRLTPARLACRESSLFHHCSMPVPKRARYASLLFSIVSVYGRGLPDRRQIVTSHPLKWPPPALGLVAGARNRQTVHLPALQPIEMII